MSTLAERLLGMARAGAWSTEGEPEADQNVQGADAFSDQVKAKIETLNRLSKHFAHAEMHLNGENSDRAGRNDKPCPMKARLEYSGIRHAAAAYER